MSGTPANGGPDVNVEVEKVASLVSTARRLLDDGKMVDLAGLQRNVDVLCQAVRQAPLKNAKALKDSVAAILADLDQLAEALTAQYEALSRRLEGTVRREAMNAYAEPKDTS